MTAPRAKRRRELRELVEAGRVGPIVEWARGVPDAPALLVTRLFDRDDGRRWTATVALARVLGEVRLASGLEPVRVIVRRLLWNMMEESGGLAWHGPEEIAEILVAVPELADEYGRITAAYVDDDTFRAGALHLIARLAPLRPELFEDLAERVAEETTSPEPIARASALRALSVLRPEAARAAAERLAEDGARLATYDGDLAAVGETTVGEVARAVLAALRDRRPGRARVARPAEEARP